LPVQILRGDVDRRVAHRLGHGMDGSERRRDDDVDVADVLDLVLQLLHEEHRFVNGLEHLPVAGDEWESHEALSVSAAAPCSGRPPRNSSDAPPPVEMWVMRSAMPAFFTAAI